MPGLFLPRRAIEEEQLAQINAEAEAQIEESKLLLRELKLIDPHLSLVLVSEHADHEEFEYPGYWYIKKEIPGSGDSYFPLIGVNGERLIPGPWVLEHLQAADLWNPAVHRSRREAKEKLRQARERAKALAEEQRQDEMAIAYRAARRVNGDGGMRRNASRKGAPKKKIILPPGVTT